MVVFNEDEIFMWHCIAFGVYLNTELGRGQARLIRMLERIYYHRQHN
jgi:hypothetical protein